MILVNKYFENQATYVNFRGPAHIKDFIRYSMTAALVLFGHKNTQKDRVICLVIHVLPCAFQYALRNHESFQEPTTLGDV